MSSLSQSTMKRLRQLHMAKGRANQKQFLGEGVRLLEESLRHLWLPRQVYFSDALINERGGALLKRFGEKQVPTSAVGTRDLRKLAETDQSQGVVAVFDIPPLEIERRLSPIPKSILYLDAIADPGNVGTLFRSALAFGVDLTVLSPGAVDPFSGKVVRSSAGAIFGMPVAIASIETLLGHLEHDACRVLAADLDGAEPGDALDRLEAVRTVILVVGSEATGLSQSVRSIVDLRVRIGHTDQVESLNAAVAGSIILREWYRRKVGK
ncbi:MAG: RNA methyltransferase [Candidatus Zixiibacteriota bacterium]|nr:MAG: RNA methyltransferase [candidate division Zixibacteria bacterium]